MNVLAGSMPAPAMAQPAVVAQAQPQPAQGVSSGLAQWLQQLEGVAQQDPASMLQNSLASEGMQEGALQAPSEEADVLVSMAQEIDAFPAFAPVLWSVAEPDKAPSAASSGSAWAAASFHPPVTPVASAQSGSRDVLRMMAVPATKMQSQAGEVAELDVATAELSPVSTATSALHGAAAAERHAAQPSVAASLPPVAVNKGEQPLVQALAQRIQVQQLQGAEVATVRLDPPQMGSLEIRISHNAAGAVQVHMQASNAEVGRQLTTLVDSLRQELQQRTTDAQVTVAQGRGTSAGAGQGDASRQQHAPQQQETIIGQALQAWDGSALI